MLEDIEGMKCELCGEGTYKKAKTDHTVDEIKITFHDVDGFKCSYCGEEVYITDQANIIEKRMKNLGLFGWGDIIGKEFEMSITSSGRRMVVGLPQEITKRLNLTAGDKAKIIVKGFNDLEVKLQH